MRNNLEKGLLHAMKAFVYVVDSGTFTAAAVRIGLTTAQVSRLVSDLEAHLGIKLLHRTTRQMNLTSYGRSYLHQCRNILELVSEAEAGAAGLLIKPAGQLRVSCMANFGNRHVVPLITHYCREYPLVTVSYTTSQYLPNLLAEGIDVSVYLSRSLSDSTLISHRLGFSFNVLCASPDYLEKEGIPDHPSDLKRHACVQLRNHSVSHDWTLENGQMSYTLSPAGPVSADIPDVLLSAAVEGMGITLLPVFTVINDVKAGRLKHILPGWRSPSIGVFALTPSRQFVDAKTATWIDALKKYVSPGIKDDVEYFGRADNNN